MRCLLAAILLALMLSAAADADPPDQQCGPLEKIQELVGKYGEAPLASMASDKGPLWLFVNPETGTFTIVAMVSAKAGCLLASGDGFRPLTHKPAKSSTSDAPS